MPLVCSTSLGPPAFPPSDRRPQLSRLAASELIDVPAPLRDLRPRAVAVLIMFTATLTLGVVLLVAFEPEIQTIDAHDLVARSDDARAFLIADYLFVACYAILSPLAIWRFGIFLGASSPPRWIKLTVLLLVAAGLVDATENTLLLSATGSVSEAAVNAAHALEIPKVSLFVSGAALAIVVNLCAARTLRPR
jgi:uncharacterized membrane protein